MPVNIEKTEWGGWPGCYRISNGEVDLIVTSDIGPRIMRYGFTGGQNLFKVFEDQRGKSGEPSWQLRGGHRLWVAPEHMPRTYAPDNGPVEIDSRDGVLTATQPVEPSTGIQKQMAVKLACTGTDVEVIHRLRNTLPFPVQYAAWAVSMMAQSGMGITGFPPRRTHAEMLAPSNPLVMWAFTDMRDKRWTFLEKYLLLRQDPGARTPTKLGHFNENTWGAYVLGSDLFFKRYSAPRGGIYPDFGCSFEAFTNPDMLELETLGPITTVETGEWLTHVEYWSLHRNIHISEWTDEGLDRVLVPVLTMWEERFRHPLVRSK
jgi:hypothetical protein